MIYVAIAFFFAAGGCLLGFLIGFALGDKKNPGKWDNSGGWPSRPGNKVWPDGSDVDKIRRYR